MTEAPVPAGRPLLGVGREDEFGRPPRRSMVWVPPGTTVLGSDGHYPEEGPAHRVEIAGFWMDEFPVTNAEFAAFVAATGYRTTAEVAPRADDYPGAIEALLVAGSAVFVPPNGPVDLGDPSQWWSYMPGANWRHPVGALSSLEERDGHPVVHVSYADACLYAAWAGKSLPSEQQWEHAARGGLDRATYAWGDAWRPNGRAMAATWEGEFPWLWTGDRAMGTSPVGSFPANRYGLGDMIGNVWEWTSSPWTLDHRPAACCGPAPPEAASPPPIRVLKGGSWLCAPSYCARYRPAARLPEPEDTSTNHVGFRCVMLP